MSNCQERSGVSPDATEIRELREGIGDEQAKLDESGLDPRKWPRTRQALLAARLDEELAKLPRNEWFDRALAVHLVKEHDQKRERSR